MARRPAVILNYHRVNIPTSEADVLAVSVKHFEEQMRALREFYFPVRLGLLVNHGFELPRSMTGGKPPVVVTFDDGYQDNLAHALPVLERFEIPATLFVTTGYIGMREEFWWDEAEELILRRIPSERLADLTPALISLCQELRPSAPPYSTADRRALYVWLCSWVKSTSAKGDPVKRVLSLLREHAGAVPAIRESHRSMTLPELKKMAAHPLVEIGAHTVHHACLGGLSAEEQHFELKESRQYLREELGVPVETVAYPYGSSDTINVDTLQLSRELGFRAGLTTERGLVCRSSDPFFLPRLFVMDWSGERFARELKKYYWLG